MIISWCLMLAGMFAGRRIILFLLWLFYINWFSSTIQLLLIRLLFGILFEECFFLWEGSRMRSHKICFLSVEVLLISFHPVYMIRWSGYSFFISWHQFDWYFKLLFINMLFPLANYYNEIKHNLFINIEITIIIEK